jgi:hypothetical protein
MTTSHRHSLRPQNQPLTNRSITVTLTLTNASDHPVSVSTDFGTRSLGVWIGYNDFALFNVAPAQATMTPGQRRTFVTTISANITLAGGASLSAALITQTPVEDVADPNALSGVASIPITIVPPGTAPGQPLDPVLGTWKVDMSADATQVIRGNGVIVHANLTNVGDKPQTTKAYDSLEIACGNGHFELDVGKVLDEATVAPGATKSFSFDFRPAEFSPPVATCSVGLVYHGDNNQVWAHRGLGTGSVAIAVLAH